MKRNQTEKPSHAEFPSRKVNFVTCPHCWTEQRAERDFCYRCGANFHYLDEEEKAPKAV